ncbi:hypothetical protein PAF17_13345 [Paracoccus sp. Z330]|uniref:Uncharacterized protein n=1 Tax=Paracoccus onchidii TaxID=3017813 RepID=A0ABT4ZGP6_9RHOB|nr:hypothetical protein [Paracoccus onchidii]MDB6178482.1 hypothetical protein [Paracoccus onchidii]
MTEQHPSADREMARNGRVRVARLRVAPVSVAALLSLSACGDRMTTDILPGGIPASTDLHQASTLPAESVRTVARRDYGWRLIYHPSRAPANAEQGAARALCALERRPVAGIEHIPRLDPYADPGAAIIDITCA